MLEGTKHDNIKEDFPCSKERASYRGRRCGRPVGGGVSMTLKAEKPVQSASDIALTRERFIPNRNTRTPHSGCPAFARVLGVLSPTSSELERSDPEAALVPILGYSTETMASLWYLQASFRPIHLSKIC
jgi:hypothetical protein